ncbi:MAG: cupin-like domain-containing protein [Bdellovibrionaceae bacterium]|nr:cupin-like domain-containing protein [Bdellovibrio sp.]
MSEIGLSALLSPMTIDDFLISAWPDQPYVNHELCESIATLKSLPFLQSLEVLLNSWPKLVQAHLPDVSDESSAVDVTPQNAKKLFANKMGLLFNNVQTISPELATWLAAIKSDLGLPVSTLARCMVYATPHGKGTAAHFDQNINFILQLEGIKKWTVAPNNHVENPTERFTIGQPVDPELASYAAPVMPTSMPHEDRQEIILQPGSMLFLPRGYWHCTEAEGEALALNFTFSQPSWADIFLAALRSRLLLSPEWRELADGVSSANQALRAQAQEKFDLLIQELREDIPNWSAADILAATEGEYKC